MTIADDRLWTQIREAMPVAKKWAYFDHAGVSPLPEPTRVAVRGWADHFAENGVVDWTQWQQRTERARQLLAARLRAEQAEIALIRNTTEGISLVAEGLPWEAGDNVVVPDSEFPSNLYPWLNLAVRGVAVRTVPCPDGVIEPAEVAQRVDSRTRVVALSWVGYASGYRAALTDLAEVAHRGGALLFVDAIQGLGVLDLDVSRVPVDFLAADGHKWMLGPEGAGVLYIRRKHLDLLRPLGVGWNSVRHAGDFLNKSLDLKDDASRYEGGTPNMVGMVGFAASLELLSEIDAPVLEQRLLSVTDLCCDRLKSLGARIVSRRDNEAWSGIVAFELPGHDPAERKRHSMRNRVVLNSRGGRLRVSPHVYTSEADVDRLVEVLGRRAP